MMHQKRICLAAMIAAAAPLGCLAFTSSLFVTRVHNLSSPRSNLCQSTSSDESTIQLTTCSGQEADIATAASFMVNAFWLESPQQLVLEGDVTESTRTALVEEQSRDLMEKYGERLGKRLLDSMLLTAVDGDKLLGAVGMEVCLLDKQNEEMIGAQQSELMLKNAVASLGPKQRRQYKDASVQEIATELLPPEISAICCLSNLCVSANARRRGIAKKLCNKVEETASEWGFGEMYLKVESENTAAKELYESKMGYSVECTLANQIALRVDPDSGFVETTADTLILKKSLQSSNTEQPAGYI